MNSLLKKLLKLLKKHTHFTFLFSHANICLMNQTKQEKKIITECFQLLEALISMEEIESDRTKIITSKKAITGPKKIIYSLDVRNR